MASRSWPGTAGSARSISATWPRTGGVLPMPRSPSTTQVAAWTSRRSGLASPDHSRHRAPAARAASTKGSLGRMRDAQQMTIAPMRASAAGHDERIPAIVTRPYERHDDPPAQ